METIDEGFSSLNISSTDLEMTSLLAGFHGAAQGNRGEM